MSKEENNESDSQKERMTNKRRFSQEQYDLLKECSDRRDTSKWNQWRIDNPDKDILLGGGLLNKFYLRRVWLNKGKFVDTSSGKEYEFTGEVKLRSSQLRGSELWEANLQGANLREINLQGAYISNANLQDADLAGANLQNANLEGASLKGAKLQDFKWERVFTWGPKLQGFDLKDFNRAN